MVSRKVESTSAAYSCPSTMSSIYEESPSGFCWVDSSFGICLGICSGPRPLVITYSSKSAVLLRLGLAWQFKTAN